MKKIYLAFLAVILSAAAMAQTISIGTSTDLPPEGGAPNTFRSPWPPVWGHSYVQTIYLQSEINTAGSISSLRFDYAGTSLDNSSQITVWMGTITRAQFDSVSDWEPVTNLTQVFDGTVSYTTLPGKVTVTLPTPFVYNNTGNLIIAIHEAQTDFDDDYFYASEVGTARTIYKVDDDFDIDPSAPGGADNIRTKVGNIEITFSGPLPVTLGNLSVENRNSLNKLAWTTHSEQNSKGFELQRSADGTSFTTIGFVLSKTEGGTSNGNLTYTFNDVQPLPGNNYYRLHQVDFDGKGAFSNIVTIKSSFAKWGLGVVYPNPVKKDLDIILTSPGNDNATVYITNVAGTVIYKTTKKVVTGNNKININAAGFAKGVYNIKAVNAGGNESASGKFVKQ